MNEETAQQLINGYCAHISDMSGESVGELVNEWQTGAIFVVGSIGIGILVGAAMGTTVGPIAGVGGFVVGAIAGFLVLSYLFYGR